MRIGPAFLRRLTIRHQLMIGMVLVHAVLMSLLVTTLVNTQASFLREQSLEQTRSLAQTLAVSEASWLMADDLVGLQEVVQSVARAPDVRYAMLISPEGRVLAHSEAARVGQYLEDAVSLGLLARPPEAQTLLDDDEAIDVAAPVLAGARLIGWARVATGQHRIAAELTQVRREGALLSLAAMALGALLAALMARRLVQGLDRLVAAVSRVRAGARGFRVRLQRHDEIGQLGDSFDRMLDSLETSESERTQAMQALQASEERFRDLTMMSADWFWEQDAEYRFTILSSGLTTRSNIGLEDTLGRSRWDLKVENPDSPEWQAHRALVERHEPFQDFVYQVRNDNGELRWLAINGKPRFDAEGRFLGYRGVGRDLTERKLAEATREALEQQLRESQKMEAIGTLAGGIAHDFNNILGAILGNAELARSDLPPDHPVRERLNQISRSGARARDLVQRILAFSRRGPGERVDLQLQPRVEETLSMLHAMLPASVALEATLAAEPIWVHGDATQLQQVLMNLCTNAWHALDGRPGRIEVGLEPLLDAAAARPAAWPPGLATGPCAHLWVRDNGVGMDAATRARIFEPFFTTKPEGQGTGLGLSMVHGIVASHGGTIGVDTAPGQGSCFHVYLPRVPSRPAAERDAGRLPVATQGRGQQVLYVDDDETMVLLVEQLLHHLGYRATTCQDACEALALVRARPQDFDLVLTDYNMPTMSGLDVARAVRALRADLPVVVSSGHFPHDLFAAAAEAGVRGFIQKEHMTEQLGPAVAQALAA